MSTIKEEIGNKHGQLTVLSFSEKPHKYPTWICRCDCENIVEVTGTSLRSGNTKSCGCLTFFDLSGQTFHRLFVLSRAENKKTPSGQEKTHWLCTCVCGKERVVAGSALQQETIRSCGCLKIKLTSEQKVSRQIFREYVRGAKDRGLEFSISLDQFLNLAVQACSYCGEPPTNRTRYVRESNRQYGYFQYNGLDRVNNALGYLISNVLPCCGDCNRAKHKQTKEQFFAQVKKVYEKQGLGN